jgi:hypothetical protein
MQLRTYVMVDRMQPQYAAFTGKQTLGMIPIEGDAQIYIEMSPAAEVYKIMDIALKTTNVQPGYLSMGREYGFFGNPLQSPGSGAVHGAKNVGFDGFAGDGPIEAKSTLGQYNFRHSPLPGAVN